MRRLCLSTCLIASFCGLLATGCGPKGRPLSLKNLFRRSPSPSEQVSMTFDSDDPDRRREGIEMLSKHSWGLKDPYLKGYALLLESDPEPLVRCAAVRALGKAGNSDYLPNVTAALADESPAVRWDAAEALDELIGIIAIGPLCDHASDDSSPDVRMSAAKALRHYPQERTFYTLIQCLSDEAFGVRYRAHASLVELTGRDVGFEPGEWSLLGAGALKPNSSGRPRRRWWNILGRREPADQPEANPAGADSVENRDGS